MRLFVPYLAFFIPVTSMLGGCSAGVSARAAQSACVDGGSWGSAQGGFGSRATAGGSLGGGVQVGGGAQGGAQGGATVEGSASGGTAGSVPVAPWSPVFYGIPLAGSQDVVFVLDRSASMTEASSGVPSSNPIALAASVGFQLLAAPPQPLSPTAWLQRGPLALQPVSTPSKMETARSELAAALAALPDGTRFNIVFFNERVSAYAPQLTTMTPLARWNAMNFVRTIGPDGATAAVPALRTAYTTRPSRVVFLSDGLTNTGGTRDQLLAEARIEIRRGVRFDTVGVGSNQDASMMRSMAVESGGQWVQR
jgi:hypothetical protein